MRSEPVSNTTLQNFKDADMSNSIERFRKFLKIPAISSEKKYLNYNKKTVELLEKMIKNEYFDLGNCTIVEESKNLNWNYSIKVVELVKDKPILIVSVEGEDPDLPALLFNCHYDVVPVDKSSQKQNPFSAFYDSETNRIYGRGTQDMKSVGIQVLEALSNLMKKKMKRKRSIHVVFVPDEEIGGKEGVEIFVESEEFKKLNVGYVFDEGLANESNQFSIFYGERSPLQLKFKIFGETGHGSRFVKETATSKLHKIMNHLEAFRQTEEAKIGSFDKKLNRCLKLGDVTTLNLTNLRTSILNHTSTPDLQNRSENNDRQKDQNKSVIEPLAPNVIPSCVEAIYDVRFNPHEPHQRFFDYLDKNCCQDSKIEIEYLQYYKEVNLKAPPIIGSKLYLVFTKAIKSLGHELEEPSIFPASTDSRFYRRKQLMCLGFSPIKNTPILLHDHNEYLGADVFLEGISVYERLIYDLANAQLDLD